MKKLFLLLVLISSLLFFDCNAQYSILLNFNGYDGATGGNPLIISGKKLYGMTNNGGIYGSGNIFSINADGSQFSDLHDFNDTLGEYPYAGLAISGNRMYGTTSSGGLLGEGCIFSINTDGSGFIDIYDFYGANGASPTGSLTLLDNWLYGITGSGGTYNNGCIFAVYTDGSGYKKIFNFGINEAPCGSLTLVGKVLYGMTEGDGQNGGHGFIFSIDTNGGLKIIYSFNSSRGCPSSAIMPISGNILFGTTQGCDDTDFGCIFSIKTNGKDYRDMFDFDKANGEYPRALTLVGGTLFGTCDGGPKRNGCIFSIDTNGSGFKDLFDFNGTDGDYPGDLTDFRNVLYGVTSEGGSNACYHGCGVIFSYGDTSLGINELNTPTGAITIYPNPNNGKFTLQINNVQLAIGYEKSQIEIYNMLGEKIYSQYSTVHYLLSIDLSSQPNGVYLYRVLKEDNRLIEEGKLIIQK